MNRKHKKNISCECKCKFNGRKCKSDQKENKNKFRCECKNQIKHQCLTRYIRYIFGIIVHVLAKIVNTWKVLLMM